VKPSIRLPEDRYSFLDIGPLAKGHALIIPKGASSFTRTVIYRVNAHACITDHAAKLHELPDEYLADVMPIAKKIATAQGLENYNILQVRFHFPHPPLLQWCGIDPTPRIMAASHTRFVPSGFG
jgi:hypothetical protein